MRRLLPISIAVIAVAAGLLSTSAGAVGPVQGGYDGPTRALEQAFKIALFYRSGRDDGCYPPPAELVPLFKKEGNLKSSIVPGFGGVRRTGIVYILKRRTNCNRLTMATPARGETLSSRLGPGPGLHQGRQEEAGGDRPNRQPALLRPRDPGVPDDRRRTRSSGSRSVVRAVASRSAVEC